MLRNIEPQDLELLLAELVKPDRWGYSIERADLRDLRRILTVLPAEEVKTAALAAVAAALLSE